MTYFVLVVVILSIIFVVVSGHEVHDLSNSWDYMGQSKWKDLYAPCGGSHQSPIDFEDACFPGSVTRVNKSLRIKLMKYNNLLPIEGYDNQESKDKSLMFMNNGHTAKLVLKGTNEKNEWAPKISGSVVNHDVYQFNELHFHWDQNDTQGSEHSIDGSRYALEMHMVHWNVKYESMKEAAQHSDGLAVVAILFTPSIQENKRLSPIIDYLDEIVPYGSKVMIHEQFSLSSFLPFTFQTFYRYQGSLTTPPCSQSVTWIVLAQVQKVGYAQLNEFTCLDNRENTMFGNTNRQTQPLNERIVEVSTDAHCFKNHRKRLEKEGRKRRNSLQQNFLEKLSKQKIERPFDESHVPSSSDEGSGEIMNLWQLLTTIFLTPFSSH